MNPPKRFKIDRRAEDTSFKASIFQEDELVERHKGSEREYDDSKLLIRQLEV